MKRPPFRSKAAASAAATANSKKKVAASGGAEVNGEAVLTNGNNDKRSSFAGKPAGKLKMSPVNNANGFESPSKGLLGSGLGGEAEGNESTKINGVMNGIGDGDSAMMSPESL
jgi:hypothetical protein